jgi:Galactose oxidase, central domain
MSYLLGRWSRLPLPIVPRSSQILAVVNRSAILYSGELKPREPVDNGVLLVSLDQEVMHQTNKHIVTDNAPSPRVGSAGAALADTFFVFSGRSGKDCTTSETSLHAFHIPTQTWSMFETLTDRPEARSYHALAASADDNLYLHAGCSANGQRLNDFWCFTRRNNVWARLADAPGQPRGGPSIAISGEKVYRIGGYDGKAEIGGFLDVYDIATDTWESIPYQADGIEGPSARSVGALVEVQVADKPLLLYIFGEGHASSLGHAGAGNFWDDVWVHQVGSKGPVWTKLLFEGERPEPRGWFAAASTGSSAIIQGGLHTNNERLGDWWELTVHID